MTRSSCSTRPRIETLGCSTTRRSSTSLASTTGTWRSGSAPISAWVRIWRVELRVMFEELLRSIPDWELVDADEPKILPATFARAYDRVRIRFTPESR